MLGIVLPTDDSGINGAHSENERNGNIINDAGSLYNILKPWPIILLYMNINTK